MSREEVAFLSGTELLSAYRGRQLSPVEVTTATLERIDRLNPKLNAYLAVDHDGAMNAAREAERIWAQPGEKPLLCGVPISIKDLIYTSWLPTTFGSVVFKDYYSPHSAPAVERVQAAGATVLGKTNTPEFGLIDMTMNKLGDDGRNPWNLDHTCGGSSGGAGAAVAAGLGPMAIGTDGAGSIRIPSFYNGIYGLKPTFGRIAHDGWKGAPRTSHQGPMTRTVRDAVLVMQAASGPDGRDPLSLPQDPPSFFQALEPGPLHGTKVALSLDYGYLELDPEIRQAVLAASDLLRSLGCEIVESDPPRQEPVAGAADTTAPDEYAWAAHLKPDFAEHFGELTGYARRIIEPGMTTPAWKYSLAVRAREAWAAAVHHWFEGYDFLLAPVMALTAPRCDERRPIDQDHPWPGSFLPIFNASGNPAASVPFGFHSNGLPLAVQIAGRWGDDVGVLRMSAAIEAARPWADKWPTIAKEPTADREP
jgi:aspartyl-tRNA(Asn)/glutamyl-tRNA(Gln) amidotransferase subunit A